MYILYITLELRLKANVLFEIQLRTSSDDNKREHIQQNFEALSFKNFFPR
jgi:hypothetical protein